MILGCPGLDVNSQTRKTIKDSKESRKSYTSLHLAAKLGKVEIVALLLSVAKVDVNVKAGEQRGERFTTAHTALHVAAEKGHTQVVEALLSAPGIKLDEYRRMPKEFFWFHNDLSPLELAKRNQHPKVVKLLENAGFKW